MQVDSVELITTLRPVAWCGAPSSQDYNDSMKEILTDLASLADFCNSVLVPLLSGLPEPEGQEVPPLDGRSIYANPGRMDPLFYDPARGPVTIADSLAFLESRIASLAQAVDDLSARVTALQSRLATSNQADLTRWISSLQDRIALLESRVSAMGA